MAVAAATTTTYGGSVDLQIKLRRALQFRSPGFLALRQNWESAIIASRGIEGTGPNFCFLRDSLFQNCISSSIMHQALMCI